MRILFSKESTEGVEQGQTTADSGFKKETVTKPIGIDYDDETLRAESAEEVARQWED